MNGPLALLIVFVTIFLTALWPPSFLIVLLVGYLSAMEKGG